MATLNDLAQGVETILPGIGEGKILTGQDTPEGVAAFYHQRGVKNVVVKTGKEGAYFSQLGGKAGYSPAFPVKEKVDTVGAGDGFAARRHQRFGRGRKPGGSHLPGAMSSGPSKSPTAAITRACPPGSASPRLSWRVSPKGGGLWNGRRSSPTWTTPC